MNALEITEPIKANRFLAPCASWCLDEEEVNPLTGKHFEGAFTQGTSYVHLRGSYEEGLAGAPQNEEYMRLPANVTAETPRHPRSKFGVYIPGVTGLHPLLREELVNLPYGLKLEVLANNARLDMDECVITNYRRTLDMRDAVLYRSFRWQINDAALQCEYTRFVSMAQPNLIVVKAVYTADSAINLHICASIDSSVKTNGYRHFVRQSTSESGVIAATEVETDTGDVVITASRLIVNGAEAAPVNGMQNADIQLRPGQSVEVLRYVAVAASCKEKDLSLPSLCGLLLSCGNMRALYDAHADKWRQLWKKSEVTITGDEKAQKAISFSVYHLLRSASANGGQTAVCAKGFAGEAYFGHFFWDTEIYLLPFFLYTNPEIAESLLRFRINTLPGAMRNAKAYGYDGAKYAWESSITGDEQCPNWQYCDNEIHVSADVVFGIWHYYRATEDKSFLAEGLPVMIQTARYWLSRVSYKNGGGVALNGVMGPDEYLCFCNNNSYTNAMVKRTLSYTLQAVEACPEAGCKLTEQELELIDRIIEELPVPKNSGGVLNQCDGFDELEELDFEAVWKDRSKPFAAAVSQERNYRSKALKQADALMLPFLFPAEYTGAETNAIYNRYYPFTTHDSSLSYIVHAIVKARLGETGTAYALFERAMNIDLNYGAAEGIHIANCGGVWQGLMLGFAGMRSALESNSLSFTPHLPRHWQSLEFNIIFRNKPTRVKITQSGYTATPEE